MIELRRGLETYRSAAAFIRDLRPDIPRIIDQIVADIQDAIPSYAGPSDGRRHALIVHAVETAIEHFLLRAEGKNVTSRELDQTFYKLGYGEATDRGDMAPLRAAFGVATRVSWARLRTFSAEHDLPASAIGPFGDAIFDFINHLDHQATLGFRAAMTAMDTDIDLARMRILDSLLNPVRFSYSEAQLKTSGWQMPESAVLLAVEFSGKFPRASHLSHEALVRAASSPAIVLCSEADADGLVEEVQQFEGVARMARCWPVPIEEVPDALRWARRALQLRAKGVIADHPVIDCFTHRPVLWLHAEPQLRRDMVQDILGPLLRETPNSREILSEALFVWLEYRDTAPAMAAVLGVHPQTFRYRWKRVNELFGEALRDPDFTTQLIMVLRSSLPLWKAGDQGDFARWNKRGKK